jgi:hypothetical protein
MIREMMMSGGNVETMPRSFIFPISSCWSEIDALTSMTLFVLTQRQNNGITD